MLEDFRKVVGDKRYHMVMKQAKATVNQWAGDQEIQRLLVEHRAKNFFDWACELSAVNGTPVQQIVNEDAVRDFFQPYR